MSVNFPSEEISNYERMVRVGSMARKVYDTQEWKWIYENIFGAMQDQAVIILKNAKTEEDRVKAQQIFIAAHKPKELIEQLIRDGDAASEAMKQISTLEGENNG